MQAVVVGALCAASVLAPSTVTPALGAKRPRSLPAAEGTGPPPGPPVLYAKPAAAPQLENTPASIWKAPPILVSRAGAYRKGEFLYQGYLYDDHGAQEVTDTSN